jgi:hypothetical protein
MARQTSLPLTEHPPDGRSRPEPEPGRYQGHRSVPGPLIPNVGPVLSTLRVPMHVSVITWPYRQVASAYA